MNIRKTLASSKNVGVNPYYCHSKVLNQPKHLQNSTNVDRREKQTNQTTQTRNTNPAVSTSMSIQREEEKQTSSDLVLSFYKPIELARINRFFVVLN